METAQGLKTLTALPIHLRTHARKLALSLFSLSLFIVALQIMKTGAHPLEPLIHEHLQVHSLWDGLGFGWITASAILSGSPVAAIAVTLYDGRAISRFAAFGMINGSRIGAAFMVLLVGYLYSLRGERSRDGIGVGLLAALVAQSVHFPALLIGSVLLRLGMFERLPVEQMEGVTSLMDRALDPLLDLLTRLLPDVALFPLGVLIMLFCFRLFDRALPEVTLENTRFSSENGFLSNPLLMFALGFGITFLTLSVSVSLGLLVPLTAKQIINREQVVPYIMGAGISTFADTFVAAVILQDAKTIALVTVAILTITLISMTYILVAFRAYERALLRFTDLLMADRWTLRVYLAAFVLIPFTLILT
jgi:Na+/phosphate symporter